MTVKYAVVPAAGEGTRLRPLTEDTPKPLVEVAGRPLLEHVLEALRPVDPDAYVVVIGYRGDLIREQFGEQYRDTPIRYVRQTERLGLAHAVARASSIVDADVVVCNGDNVFGTDLTPLASAHDGDATMLVEETSIDRARETGVVVTDADGRVQRVVEKPAEPPSTLVTAGAYAFSPAIFDACEAIEPSDRGEYELADAITWLLDRGYEIETIRFDGERSNVNEPADLDRADEIVEHRSC